MSAVVAAVALSAAAVAAEAAAALLAAVEAAAVEAAGGGGGGGGGRCRRRRTPSASLWRDTVRIQWGYSEDTVSYSTALRLCHPPSSLPPQPTTFRRRRTPQSPLFGGIQ